MNIAICSILLKDFIKPFEKTLLSNYQGTEDRFQAVLNQATDDNNEEIITILNWIESKNLKETFFQ